MLTLLFLMLTSCTRTQASTDIAFCGGASACAGRNPFIANVRVLQQLGARPRFSPDGQRIVFDRKNADGYYDVYLTDRDQIERLKMHSRLKVRGAPAFWNAEVGMLQMEDARVLQ